MKCFNRFTSGGLGAMAELFEDIAGDIVEPDEEDVRQVAMLLRLAPGLATAVKNIAVRVFLESLATDLRAAAEVARKEEDNGDDLMAWEVSPTDELPS